MNSSVFRRTLRFSNTTLKLLSKRSSNAASPALTNRLAIFSPIINRQFSSSNLSSILERELVEEKDKISVPPDDFQELQDTISKDWTIVNDGESGIVKLFRKEGPQKVTVMFHCQDTLEDNFIDEIEEEGEEEEEESAPEVRFTLTVTKAGKTMVLSCASILANAVVESVATTNEDIEIIHDTGKIDETLYQGPQFDELAEDLQDAFTEFVQGECGITSDVAAFISMYADFKEQEEYVSWLQRVKDII